MQGTHAGNQRFPRAPSFHVCYRNSPRINNSNLLIKNQRPNHRTSTVGRGRNGASSTVGSLPCIHHSTSSTNKRQDIISLFKQR